MTLTTLREDEKKPEDESACANKKRTLKRIRASIWGWCLILLSEVDCPGAIKIHDLCEESQSKQVQPHRERR